MNSEIGWLVFKIRGSPTRGETGIDALECSSFELIETIEKFDKQKIFLHFVPLLLDRQVQTDWLSQEVKVSEAILTDSQRHSQPRVP